ncbi:DNA-J chaperone, putative [Bodo saltans]|uniref:DNA-J chaperone, putative n=1 Tax=Bodo saltans TaxID=75058 RepID=A0A0S4J3B2_BODSA|nr:DNA-J chaperone, putative [Bodo saltans]|eukprot:CUG67522.1 DNA-J chaperone, putative [Bodo saltans]
MSWKRGWFTPPKKTKTMRTWSRRGATQCARLSSASARHFQTIERGKDVHTKTPWEILGFKNESIFHAMERSPEELRLGLVREARKLSPSTSDGDAKKLEGLLRAYDMLSSSDRVALQYASHNSSSIDANLHVLIEGGEQGANYNPEHQSFDFSERAREGARTFGDITGDAMKNATEGGASSRAAQDVHRPISASAARAATTEPKRGADVSFTLHLSFDESIFGCEKVIVFDRSLRCRPCLGSGRKEAKSGKRPPCPMCHGAGKVTLPSGTYLVEKECSHCAGDGRHAPALCGGCRGTGTASRSERVPVVIKPGACAADVHVIHGKGNHGQRGGPVGDLKVSLVIEEHRVFRRIEDDLHVVIPIPLSTALLGGFITVPSLKGPTQVQIPPNVRSGEIVTVQGAGVPRTAATTSQLDGSLKVHLVVVIPTASTLTGRQRSALEAFAQHEREGSAAAAAEEGDATRLIRKGLEDMKARYGSTWFRSAATPAAA